MPEIQLLIYGADREEIAKSVNTVINQFEEDKYCYGALRGKFESIARPNPTWWWYDDKYQKVSDDISISLTDKSPAMELNILVKPKTAEMCRFVHGVANAIPKQICSDIHNVHVHMYTTVSCGTNYNLMTNNGSLFETNV